MCNAYYIYTHEQMYMSTLYFANFDIWFDARYENSKDKIKQK